MEAKEDTVRLTSSVDRLSPESNDGRTVTGKIKIKEALFLATLAGFSILGGFGMTIAMAKKRDSKMFAKGLLPTHELPDSGGALALRALGWGTFYSVAGVGSLCFVVWKLLGVHNLMEFRQKMGHVLPKIPKKDNPGRSEFSSIRDLVQYLIDEDERKKGR